jgi:hypothetical protein
LAESHVSASCFKLSGFVSGLLFCPYFARISTIVNQGLQPGGFGARSAQVPNLDVSDGQPDRFAE